MNLLPNDLILHCQGQQTGKQTWVAKCAFFGPLSVFCVNYSSLCVALGTEQLFREQLI